MNGDHGRHGGHQRGGKVGHVCEVSADATAGEREGDLLEPDLGQVRAEPVERCSEHPWLPCPARGGEAAGGRRPQQFVGRRGLEIGQAGEQIVQVLSGAGVLRPPEVAVQRHAHGGALPRVSGVRGPCAISAHFSGQRFLGGLA